MAKNLETRINNSDNKKNKSGQVSPRNGEIIDYIGIPLTVIGLTYYFNNQYHFIEKGYELVSHLFN